MWLPKSFRVEILGVISKESLKWLSCPNQWVGIHHKGKQEMDEDSVRKQVCDHLAQVEREVWSLPIVVEHKELVNPKLEEEADASQGIKSWHS